MDCINVTLAGRYIEHYLHGAMLALVHLRNWRPGHRQRRDEHVNKCPEQSSSYSLGPDLKQRATQESWEGVSEQDRLFQLCLWRKWLQGGWRPRHYLFSQPSLSTFKVSEGQSLFKSSVYKVMR